LATFNRKTIVRCLANADSVYRVPHYLLLPPRLKLEDSRSHFKSGRLSWSCRCTWRGCSYLWRTAVGRPSSSCWTTPTRSRRYRDRPVRPRGGPPSAGSWTVWWKPELNVL